ncbi:MAG: hypothetical protein NVS4B5_09180 [Vulcanimicrobiaceae bacterium]
MHRRNAEIEEHAVDGADAQVVEGRAQIRKIRTNERDRGCERRREPGAGIAIEGDDASATAGDRSGVTARPEGGIDVRAARDDRERLEAFVEEDRDVRCGVDIIVNRGRAPW